MRDSRTSIPFQTSSGLRNLVWGEPSKIEVEKDELCRIRRSPRNNLPELRERERERGRERDGVKKKGVQLRILRQERVHLLSQCVNAQH
jgi:hypothetical protein